MLSSCTCPSRRRCCAPSTRCCDPRRTRSTGRRGTTRAGRNHSAWRGRPAAPQARQRCGPCACASRGSRCWRSASRASRRTRAGRRPARGRLDRPAPGCRSTPRGRAVDADAIDVRLSEAGALRRKDDPGAIGRIRRVVVESRPGEQPPFAGAVRFRDEELRDDGPMRFISITPRSPVCVPAARSCQAVPLIEVTSTVIPASTPTAARNERPCVGSWTSSSHRDLKNPADNPAVTDDRAVTNAWRPFLGAQEPYIHPTKDARGRPCSCCNITLGGDGNRAKRPCGPISWWWAASRRCWRPRAARARQRKAACRPFRWSLTLPADNPGTPERVALGRLLFWDPVLSGQKDVACATCHHPAFGYTDGLDLSIGQTASGSALREPSSRSPDATGQAQQPDGAERRLQRVQRGRRSRAVGRPDVLGSQSAKPRGTGAGADQGARGNARGRTPRIVRSLRSSRGDAQSPRTGSCSLARSDGTSR